MDRIKAWLWWRLPRLWLSRTAYSLWVTEQRNRLRNEIDRRPTTRPGGSDA